MFKRLAFIFLVSASLVLGATLIPILGGYDLLAGHASYTDGALGASPITNLHGYFYASNTTGTTSWQIPRQVFTLTSTNSTNVVLSFNILSTNGVDIGGHGLAYYLRLYIYTNVINSNAISLGTPTNTFVPYYDSGNKTILGTFKNGTNIEMISFTNTVSSTLFSNTNIAFGVVNLTHNSLGGSLGSEWILNGRVVIK